jgi:hypothetical protein
MVVSVRVGAMSLLVMVQVTAAPRAMSTAPVWALGLLTAPPVQLQIPSV